MHEIPDLDKLAEQLRGEVRRLFDVRLGTAFAQHCGVPESTLNRFALGKSKSITMAKAELVRLGLLSFDES